MGDEARVWLEAGKFSSHGVRVEHRGGSIVYLGRGRTGIDDIEKDVRVNEVDGDGGSWELIFRPSERSSRS